MSNIVVAQAAKLASTLGLQANGAELIDTLKATAFKGDVTDAQMTALMVVANQYGLNPWTKEIYAFPDKANGIVPVVGVDGWSRIINSHPQFDGMEFEFSNNLVKMPEAKSEAPEWIECRMYRKDRSRPVTVREYLDECYREPFKGQYGQKNGPWQSHPKRFLRHKAMIQCARLAFSFVGIYDADEAERLIEAEGSATSRPASNPQAAVNQQIPDGYEQFEAKHLQAMRDAAMNGADALQRAFAELPKGAHKTLFWQNHGKDLKAASEQATVIDVETGEVL